MLGSSTTLAVLAVLLPAALAESSAGPAGEAYTCAPGSLAARQKFCDASLSRAARLEALVNAIPSSTYPDQLANGNFGGARSNVSSLGLPTFNYAHEACHGLLHCGVCATPCSAGAGCCDDTCPAAATSFPQVIGLAASFNSTLWRLVGATISTEARANTNVDPTGPNAGINFWAPNMNILRAPLSARLSPLPLTLPPLPVVPNAH